MATVAAYVAVATLSFVNGEIFEAVGDGFETYDACMVQAEADAKNMALAAEEQEKRLAHKVLKHINVECVFVDNFDGHTGYIPLEEYYGN